jgi:hypothetical protein
MPTKDPTPQPPPVTKLGARRVRTKPLPGHHAEPPAPQDPEDSGAHDERLRAEKPPHY